MWTLVQYGSPHYLEVDKGSNYTSEEFRKSVTAAGIELKETSIEMRGAICTVELYHTLLRRAYKFIRDIMDKGTTNDYCFCMAVLEIISTM